MGVYYYAVCHEKREQIDPGKIGGGCNKEQLVYYSAGNVIAHAMRDRWRGHDVAIVPDTSDKDMERISDYADVSREAVDAYNAGRPDFVALIEFNERG